MYTKKKNQNWSWIKFDLFVVKECQNKKREQITISFYLKGPQWWSFPAAERIPWAPMGGRAPGNSKGQRNSCARLGSSCSRYTPTWWWKPDLRTQDSQMCQISAQLLRKSPCIWAKCNTNAMFMFRSLEIRESCMYIWQVLAVVSSHDLIQG